MALIYCVEDDESIRELIIYALKSGGYEAEGFPHCDGFYKAMKERIPDIVLLDIMLPKEDGLTILSKLKTNAVWKDVLVVMLTAKSAEYDKVKGLDMGADDYIVKPFGIMELLSRIRALLRRRANDKRPEEKLLSYGGVILDYDKRIVTAGDDRCSLTYKEFELLYYLLKNVNIVLSREKIMEAVWGFDFEGESRTVDMHIGTLRQKLGDYGQIIQTVRGVGYKIGG